MKLSDVQTYIQGRLTADSTLTALAGTIIIYDPFSDPNDSEAVIAAQLRATGVCIEVGDVSAVEPVQEALGGSPNFYAVCTVFAAENPQVAHSLSKLPLVERIIADVCVRSTGHPAAGRPIKPAKLGGYAAEIHNQGNVLHAITFKIPVVLTTA